MPELTPGPDSTGGENQIYIYIYIFVKKIVLISFSKLINALLLLRMTNP
jgi:hypothetical protein